MSRLLRERLEAILEALERVPGRFEKVKTPQDFVSSEEKFALSPAAAFAIIPNWLGKYGSCGKMGMLSIN